MEESLHRIWNKGKTPYVRAIGLFLIILLAELGLVDLISGIGFSTEIQEQRNLISGISTAVALSISIIWLLYELRKPRNIVFIKSGHDNKIYLKDLHGKAREIPDRDTHSYLMRALSASDLFIDVSPEEITKLRGEKLDSIKTWKRPLTPDEVAKKEIEKELRSKVYLEKGGVNFVQNTSPQKIVIQIKNNGKNLVHIKNIKLLPYSLTQESFSASYTTIDGVYISIPLPENKATIESGQSIPIEIELRQKWKRTDIEKIFGNIGSLDLEILHEGNLVNEILIII